MSLFPQSFLWGVATSSYQIEGAYNVDGRGLSVWDVFCERPNAVFNGDHGKVACDHYHRYPEDVQLIKSMGVPNYRLSLSWSRILPEGTGAINEKGLSFYDKLIDELLTNGITPHVTLFHWDYPQALYERGGWMNRDSVEWFADYTRVVVNRLGDRVKSWMTWNEPACFVGLGHADAVHAPGVKLAPREVLRVAHHALVAHGRAVQVLRAYQSDYRIGFASTGEIGVPHQESDVESARRYTFDSLTPSVWKHSWWADPAILGRYPDSVHAAEAIMPANYQDDLAIIHQPLDFFGLNIYRGERITTDENRQPRAVRPTGGSPLTLIHWDVTPSAMYWAARFLNERYQLPVTITENGLASMDWVHQDGQVHDPQRIDFLHTHLIYIAKALQDGYRVDGYFQWSLMDNFEWAEGMRHRFGLIYVDYATQQRILKDSAYWYRDIVASNGASIAP